MSRIFLIHGWTGAPDKDWFPWIKNELKKQGHEVYVPVLPDSAYPKIDVWTAKIKEVVGEPKKDDIFIGHSMGCQAILRYLETLPENTKIKKVILIAGFEKLKEAAFEVPEDKIIFKPWRETPIDYEKIRKMTTSWIAIFSDNDPIVSYKENSLIFKEKLNAKIVLIKDMGHFNQEANIDSFPHLLEFIK